MIDEQLQSFLKASDFLQPLSRGHEQRSEIRGKSRQYEATSLGACKERHQLD